MQQGDPLCETGDHGSSESTDDPYAPGGSRQASQREDGQAGTKSSAKRMCESGLQYSSEASGEVR